jgi:protoporphyrinogen oxidase
MLGQCLRLRAGGSHGVRAGGPRRWPRAWSIATPDGDITWDRHYHVTLLSDAALRRVLDQLGLDAEMQWVETKTGYFSEGHLSSVSNTVEFLRLPGLPIASKLRLALTILHGSRVKDWEKLN